MLLLELFAAPVPGYQDVESDQSKPQWKQSRKTKLTLMQIRKLRKMLDVRKYEERENLKKVYSQYAPKADAEGGPAL